MDDPIFAAIARHKAAAAAFTPEAGQDELRAAKSQLFTAPITIDGLIALILYMDEVRLEEGGTWDEAWSLADPDEMLDAIVAVVRRL